ncbi:MAG: type II secretion system protein GspC [Kofleriaceae bacterium]
MHRSALVLVALIGSAGVARADDLDPLYACKVPPAGTKLSVSFQPETSLRDLATWVTGFTCKNIVFSADVPKHATKVTIMSPTKMTPKQALDLFVDAVEATGLVVQIKPATIIIKLGPKMPRSCPDTKVTSDVGGELGGDPFDKKTGPAEAPVDSDADALAGAVIEAGIKKIDATHYEMTDVAIDKIFSNPMVAAKGARVVPSVTGGKPTGFKLYAIRPSSVWAKLGFRNGDAIRSINGMPLDTPDQALEVYTKIREARRIDVAITRQGTQLTITINVKR